MAAGHHIGSETGKRENHALHTNPQETWLFNAQGQFMFIDRKAEVEDLLGKVSTAKIFQST